MKPRDILESALAVLICLTYCYLVAFGKASVEGFVAVAVYIIKKYMDGVEQQRNGKNGGA